MELLAVKLGMQFNDGARLIEVFNDVDLAIATGGSVAIIGNSGVGKTTLLYILGALEEPTSGEVYIDGVSITKLQRTVSDIAPYRGEKLGFIFQSHNLLPEFDAVENVMMPLLIKGESYSLARGKAAELLERVGLKDRLTHRPGTLSGGEQQRVAIARALVAKPGIILADEPTGNLDKKTGDSVTDLLIRLHKEEKSTLIVVTHSSDVANRMERVLELTPAGLLEK